jgi:hypothetical protein
LVQRDKGRSEASPTGPDLSLPPVVLSLPFRGRWLVQNSPSRRIPSHGTHLFATTYAIDFVPVDDRGRSAPRSWRSILWTERPEAFVGFGRAVLSPAAGTIVVVHDGEEDHVARRSPSALLAYAVTQAGRIRGGAGAIAGNHVVIALPDGAHVLAAHLQQGSVAVGLGDRVAAGTPIGACGNSGNSTEPHVHLQAMDGPDAATARGLQISFRDLPGTGIPGEGAIVEG